MIQELRLIVNLYMQPEPNGDSSGESPSMHHLPN